MDDEQDICDNLRDILTEFGYAVDTTAAPAEALLLVETRAYDLALFDLRMADLDGIELCRRIHARRPTTVGVIITAYADAAALADASAAGAYRVLGKPIDARLLLGLIESVLNRPLVLVVDDDDDLCAALCDVLAEEGFRCGVAHSAGEFERELVGHRPQVVLLDLRLADADGLDLLIQARGLCPESRTIIITAHHEEMARRTREAAALGVAAICLKPFQTAELLSRIRASMAAG